MNLFSLLENLLLSLLAFNHTLIKIQLSFWGPVSSVPAGCAFDTEVWSGSKFQMRQTQGTSRGPTHVEPLSHWTSLSLRMAWLDRNITVSCPGLLERATDVFWEGCLRVWNKVALGFVSFSFHPR